MTTAKDPTGSNQEIVESRVSALVASMPLLSAAAKQSRDSRKARVLQPRFQRLLPRCARWKQSRDSRKAEDARILQRFAQTCLRSEYWKRYFNGLLDAALELTEG